MPTVLPSRYLVSQRERSSIRRSRSVQRVGERRHGRIGRINLAELERCPFAHNGLVGGSSPPGPPSDLIRTLQHKPGGGLMPLWRTRLSAKRFIAGVGG